MIFIFSTVYLKFISYENTNENTNCDFIQDYIGDHER